MSVKSIILKLLADVAFICGVAGGMFGIVVALNDRNWTAFLQASALFLIGIMAVAAIVPWIAYLDGEATWEENHGKATFASSAFVALMAMYCTANMLFVLAVEDGRWDICAGSIASFAVMIAVSLTMSLFWKLSKSTKVKRDPDAVEVRGVVTYVDYDYPIFVFRKMFLITEINVEIDGVRSTALLRTHSKLGKRARRGSTVTVLFDRRYPKYCYLTSVEDTAPDTDELIDKSE